MDFSITVHHTGLRWSNDGTSTANRLIDLVKIADATGVARVWVTEDPDGWDAPALLGALARETERIALGPGVLNPIHRHPNLIAASIATLDHLSNGRAFLGLGRGQPEWYAHGLGMSVPPSPLRAVERTITLMREWWRPPHTVSAEGDPDPNDPLPVRNWTREVGPKPGDALPPISIAAAGPKALDLAGRVADGVLFNDCASVTYLAESIQRVRDSATAAGRHPASIQFTWGSNITLTDDPEAVFERRKAGLALINSLPGMDRQVAEPGFDTENIMADVRQLMKTDEILARGGGFAAMEEHGDLAAAKRAIPNDLIDRLVIVGPRNHVQTRLAELARIGITEVYVSLPRSNESAEDFGETVETLKVLSAQL